MAQFLGEHEVPVDDKGRIFVPAEFRKKLPTEANETLVVVRGFDHCPNGLSSARLGGDGSEVVAPAANRAQSSRIYSGDAFPGSRSKDGPAGPG